jgi:uncharacterized membrane protein YkvA (DUF1232 family)
MIELDRLKAWARDIKRDVVALHLAAQDSRTPLIAKAVALCVVAYALSPIDLIPDFVPVVGYLDDLVVVPAGILIAIRLIPPELMAEFRNAAATSGRWPLQRAGAAFVVAVWLAVAVAATWWMLG